MTVQLCASYYVFMRDFYYVAFSDNSAVELSLFGESLLSCLSMHVIRVLQFLLIFVNCEIFIVWRCI